MRLPTLYRSTKVLAVIVTAIIVILNVPGELVSPLGGNFGGGYTAEYVHGWPSLYLYRTVKYVFTNPGPHFPDIPKWDVPWFAWDSWKFWRANERVLRIGNLLWNLIVSMLIVVGIPAIWERRRRRRNRLLQFNTRDLLIAFACVSLLIGWWASTVREYNRERLHIAALDDEVPEVVVDAEYCGPRWLELLIGTTHLPQSFHRARTALLDTPNSMRFEFVVAQLKELRELDTLEIYGWTNRPPVKFSSFKALPGLRFLDVSESITDVDVQGLTQLATLREIRFLHWDVQNPQTLNRLANAMPGVLIHGTNEGRFTDRAAWDEL